MRKVIKLVSWANNKELVRRVHPVATRSDPNGAASLIEKKVKELAKFLEVDINEDSGTVQEDAWQEAGTSDH